MSVLDGVIFAAAWTEHSIKRGKNPRPVMRRQRPSGAYEYMEMDEYNRRYGQKEQDAPEMKPASIVKAVNRLIKDAGLPQAKMKGMSVLKAGYTASLDSNLGVKLWWISMSFGTSAQERERHLERARTVLDKKGYVVDGDGHVSRYVAPAAGQRSDAERMLADPGLDFSDTVARAILHDALIDDHRDDEAARLVGPVGESVVLFEGKVLHPHQVPPALQLPLLQMELNREGTAPAASFLNYNNELPALCPAGSVRVRYPHTGGYNEGEMFPLAALIVAARRLRKQPESFTAQTILHEANDFVDTVADHSYGGVDANVRYIHTVDSQHEGTVVAPHVPPHDAPGDGGLITTYEFRSSPVIGGNVMRDKGTKMRGYYYVETIRNRVGTVLMHGQVHAHYGDRLFLSLAGADDAASQLKAGQVAYPENHRFGGTGQ